ncbi:O-antigen ligase family protein [Patescibacteria group bacterium]|nr:O-antigen ligase family protein [Patescibacteria group bacterium]
MRNSPTVWLTTIFVLIAAGLGLLVGYSGWTVAAALIGVGVMICLLRYPAALLATILVFLVLGQFARISSAGGDILILDGLVGMFFLLWLVWAVRFGRVKRLSLPLILWSGFLLIGLVSLVLGPFALGKQELAGNGFYWIRLLAYSSLAWSLPVFITGEEDGWRVLKWLLYAGMAIVLLGFVQLRLLPNIGILAKYGWDPHVGRLVSTFLDPNYLGGFFAILLSLVLAWFPLRNWRGWLLTLIIVLATMLTYSRSGYLAVGIVLLLYGLRYSWKIVAIALICVVPLTVAIPRIQERVVGAFHIDTTSQDRIDSWLVALSVSNDYPVTGVGYNSYATAQEHIGALKVGSTSRAAAGSDSSLLNVLVDTGPLGLGLFLAALGLVWWDADKKRADTSTPSGVAAQTLYMVMPALFIYTWFVNALFYPFILLILTLLVGVMYSWRGKE